MGSPTRDQLVTSSGASPAISYTYLSPVTCTKVESGNCAAVAVPVKGAWMPGREVVATDASWALVPAKRSRSTTAGMPGTAAGEPKVPLLYCHSVHVGQPPAGCGCAAVVQCASHSRYPEKAFDPAMAVLQKYGPV